MLLYQGWFPSPRKEKQTRKEADPSLCPVLGPKRGVGVAKQKVRQAGEIKGYIVSQFETATQIYFWPIDSLIMSRRSSADKPGMK